MSDFDKAFEIVIGIEDGYVNDPRDPGGETKYGISKRAHPNLDIKNLTLDGAKAIYKQDYWDKVKGDVINWPVNYLLFDYAVNSGVRQAISTLQRTLQVAVDGIIGPITLQKANQMDEESHSLFLADRALYMAGLPTFKTFGRGWLKRLFFIARK